MVWTFCFIGTFGPVDLNPKSSTYGSILNSPKLAWKGINYFKAFKSLNIPIRIDTDVNASCLGETSYGASRGLKNVIYVIVGTGIGVGIISERKLVHGMMHPEEGHILLEKQKDDKGEYSCPYHDSFFEGLASDPSINKRYGKPGNKLINGEKVWELEAEYISQALVNPSFDNFYLDINYINNISNNSYFELLNPFIKYNKDFYDKNNLNYYLNIIYKYIILNYI